MYFKTNGVINFPNLYASQNKIKKLSDEDKDKLRCTLRQEQSCEMVIKSQVTVESSITYGLCDWFGVKFNLSASRSNLAASLPQNQLFFIFFLLHRFPTYQWWITNLTHTYWPSVVFSGNRIRHFPDTSLKEALCYWSPNNLVSNQLI